ncbi:MAG: helix-turn-helix domain-containing protein [Pirellula sp.]|nr:helix-turn-helix domain-containing protein [Pirellula sp.]
MDSLFKRSTDEICTTGKKLLLPLLERCALLRSQKASRITWHAHDCFEILMVLEGSTEYEFDDGRTESLAGGQFLSIAPGVPHRGKHNVRSPAKLLGILFDPTAKNAIRNTPFTNKDLEWLTQQIRMGAGCTHRISKDMGGYIKVLSPSLENIRSANAATLVSFRLAICAILLEAAKQFSSPGVVEPTHVVQTAMDYMKQNLRFDDSIESVARIANCSRATLFSLFKESTGMTPNDYWLRLRVDHARLLLRTTNHTVTNIAMQSGFSSSQYFSAVFKKYSGTSPRDYRESCLAGIADDKSLPLRRSPGGRGE